VAEKVNHLLSVDVGVQIADYSGRSIDREADPNEWDAHCPVIGIAARSIGSVGGA
jgi:hypothetical protein